MRGASRTLRCVCVLQLLISGDTVEIDLKAPAPLVLPAAWHRTVYAYTRVQHEFFWGKQF